MLLPLLGAAIIAAMPAAKTTLVKQIALATTLVVAAAAIVKALSFDTQNTALQFRQSYSWIPSFAINWAVGVDGIALVLILMSVILAPVVILAGWNESEGGRWGVKTFYILILVLETMMIGVFAATDLFLFYVFFEAMLIPVYFLIGGYGSGERAAAAVKFLLYSLFGGLLMLASIIGLYVISGNNGGHTFDITALSELHTSMSGTTQNILFLGFFIAFAIKAPLWPFHTWLPDAHVEAPTPVSVILAALLLKTGTYGLVRYVYLILPQNFSEYAELFSIFALISIIYGALNALASKDLKRMIAYSSISHMGFVILGICAGTSMAMQGAIYQMFAHGLISTMLFLIAGSLQERTGDRLIANYSGFFSKMPSYSSMILIAFFAGMGIPGFASFIGEILVLLGTYNSSRIPGWIPLMATLGILLSAGYFAWTIQRMLFGPFHSKVDGDFTDLSFNDRIVFTVLAILIIFFGVYPGPLLDIISTFTINLPN